MYSRLICCHFIYKPDERNGQIILDEPEAAEDEDVASEIAGEGVYDGLAGAATEAVAVVEGVSLTTSPELVVNELPRAREFLAPPLLRFLIVEEDEA